MQNQLAVLHSEEVPVRAEEMTISDMARSYGVSLRTLRFYEDKDLLRPRRQGTARFYSVRDRIRLELILKGKKLGFTLAEILELIESREQPGAPSGRLEQPADLMVSLGQEQIAAQIAHLERQRADLDSAITELRLASHRMTEAVDA